MISIRQHRGSEKSAAAAGSAELSEAINSMYRWYEQARVWYVYLNDVGVWASE